MASTELSVLDLEVFKDLLMAAHDVIASTDLEHVHITRITEAGDIAMTPVDVEKLRRLNAAVNAVVDGKLPTIE